MRWVVVAMVLAACGHTQAPAPPKPPVPLSVPAPPCLDLGPDGDAGAWVGSCGGNKYDGDGHPCSSCFYDNGCVAGMVYCVDGTYQCDDPRCSTPKARKARKQ